MAQQPFKVVDPRLAAGRGDEFSAAKLREATAGQTPEEAFRLPIDQRIEDSLDTDGLQMASVHEAIPGSNRGFQMLQRMGWKGQGLGSKEDGIREPVGGGSEAGLRLGLGKQEEDDFYTASDNIQRKKLEVELQADEDVDRATKRELQAEREHRIREDVTNIKRSFYCEVCHKQYSSAAEMEVHLSSYDHHHKKRLVEMRSAEYERTRKGRDRREKRRQEKEMARLNEQIQRAHGAPGAPVISSAEAPQPPSAPSEPPPMPPEDEAAPPPPPPDDINVQLTSIQPPLPPGNAPLAAKDPSRSRGAVQFNVMGSGPLRMAQAAASRDNVLSVTRGGVQKKPQRLKSNVAGFGLDSDDES